MLGIGVFMAAGSKRGQVPAGKSSAGDGDDRILRGVAAVDTVDELGELGTTVKQQGRVLEPHSSSGT